MLLPQSSAFLSLKTRLESVQALSHFQTLPESKFAMSNKPENKPSDGVAIDFAALLGESEKRISASISRSPRVVDVQRNSEAFKQSILSVALKVSFVWKNSPTDADLLVRSASAAQSDNKA